jgi:hypothetical protein
MTKITIAMDFFEVKTTFRLELGVWVRECNATFWIP